MNQIDFVSLLAFSLVMIGFMKTNFFPNIDDYNNKMELYSAYEQLHGDMGDHRQFHFEHGDWIVVGHGQKTNSKCGQFRRYDGCLRSELHKQNRLNQSSHVDQVYVHMVHYWCFSYSCPTCFFRGACMREAEHGTQRLKFASVGGKDAKGVYHAPQGDPQHIIISPPLADWNLAEFEHKKFALKVREILRSVGVESACCIFHGFRYANYAESLEKGVPFGYWWSPHFHVVGFIVGGYGKCRNCETAHVVHTKGGKAVTKYGDKRYCMSCDGFERKVREVNEKNGYIILNTDERTTVFGTLLYQMSHMAIRKSDC
jgi:hypothetical protein